MKIILLIFSLVSHILPSLTKLAHAQIHVKLSSSLQEGDMIVVLGKFKQAPSKIQLFGESDGDKCNRCSPLSIQFYVRRRMIKISKSFGTERRVIDTVFSDRIKEIRNNAKFQVTVKVQPDHFEVKFNEKQLVNVPFGDFSYDITTQIRAYGALFSDAYVLPNDVNTPAIYDPSGENYWGNQIKDITSRIIGGKQAASGQFPWQASLRKKVAKPWSPIKHSCGAVILSSCWVATAAHCCNQVLDKNSYRNFLKDNLIRVGDIWNGDRDPDEEVLEDQQELEIKKVYINDEYVRGSNPVADIALIRLVSKIGSECIHYSEFVQPINLPPPGPNTLKPGTECIVSGWGAMNWTEVTPPPKGSLLMYADVSVKDFDECRRNYSTNIDGEDKLKRGMFCAANPGKDTCQGDSGGPIYCPRESRDEDFKVLSGITSWGEGCAEEEHPGVYADVGLYMDWIINVTGATTEKSPPRHAFSLEARVP